MLSFLAELIFGTIAVYYGRRLMIERLDESFGNGGSENFDSDEDRRGWPGFIAFLAFFGVIALAAYWKLGPWAGFIPLISVPLLVWSIGNLSSWRRLEPGNPLRRELDPVLAIEGIYPRVIRLRRSSERLPRFTFDGALEVPSRFLREFSEDEKHFIYFALAEESSPLFRRRRFYQAVSLTLGLGSFYAAIILIREIRFMGGLVGGQIVIVGKLLGNAMKTETRLTLDRLKYALGKTKDFAAAERAIYRSLPEKTADERVTALREWWATQSPANPTVAAMRSASVSATQRVGIGP